MADSSTNPYLALLQQEDKPPSLAQILQHVANLGFGMAGGLGQAASTGGTTLGGLGTGLILGNQINAQQAQRAEQERRQRLEWQFKAQEHEDKRAEVARKQKALEAFGSGFNVTPPPPQLMGPGGTPGPTPGTSDQNAIGGIESGGRYDAVGPVANKAGNRAYGKYQIMDFNVGPWTQEVLGRPMTPQEFLASPQAQDAVFNTKFGQYSQKYGPVGASRAWFAGEGGMNNPSASDVNGMTVQRYGDQFARSRGVAPAPVGPSGVSLPPVAPGGAGPTFSALPAFEGPGMGTIQPGALPEGVEPKVNLPAPFVPPPPPSAPPPQVAQGGGGPTTASGAPVDPNAPPPPFMQPGGPGGPNVVQAQYQPQSGQPTMAPAGGDAPPTYVPPPVPRLDPQTEARINAGVAGGIITPEKGIELKRQIVEDQYKKVEEAAKAQHAATMEVYKQRQETRRHERGTEEEAKRNERRLAEEAARETRRQEVEKEREERRSAAEEARFQRDLAEKEKVRAASTEQAGTKRSDEQVKAQREDENKLRDDFDKAKPVQAYRIVVPMLESAKKAGPTRAGDLNLIYAFAKLMDPESVVRESETGMVTATGSFGDRLAGLTSQLSGKQALSDEMRRKLIAELDNRFNALEASYQAHEEAYKGIAERRGLDFNNVRIPIRSDKPAEANTGNVPVYDTSGKRIK